MIDTRRTKAQEFLELHEFISGSSEQIIHIHYGNEESRRAFNRLLATISYCATAGCSRYIHHNVDGDGSYRLKIKGLDDVNTPDTDSDPIKVPGV